MLYTKNTRKKHKSWQDGYIVVTNDRHVALYDDDGKKVTSETMSRLKGLVEGNTLVVHSMLLEVQSLVSEESFLSGRLFMKTSIALPVAQHKKPPSQQPFKPLQPKKKISKPQVLQPLFNPDAADAVIIDDEGVYIVLDPCIARKIRPHQIEGVKFMYRCVKNGNGAILADDMGLGKSLQAISLVWTLLKQGKPNGGLAQKAAIVCPASLVTNWINEVKKWLGDDKLNPVALEGGSSTFAAKQSLAAFINGTVRRLLIVSYEMFRANAEELYRAGIGLLICDEGHRLKSSQGNKTIEALKRLPCRRRVILTGTPVQNDLEEFFAVCDFVNPGCFNSLASFRRVFAGPIISSRDANATPAVVKLGKARAKELSSITSQFVLRRTSAILERYLPPKQETAIFCRLKPEQEVDYEQEAKTRYNTIFGDRFSAALSAINYLRKICSHPVLAKKDKTDFDSDEEGDDMTNMETKPKDDKERMMQEFKVEDSSKMQVAISICEESLAMQDKVIVVSNFTSTLDLIEESLRREDISFCRLDGSTSVKIRGDIVRKFNEGKLGDVFLLSAKAGGVGLNLIGANRLILFDPDWNPATDLQAMARVWRDGQQKNVFVYRLLCTGTIEEKIYQRQLFKGELQSAVQDGHKEEMDSTLGGSNEGNFSRDQLKDLFQYKADLKYCDTLQVLRRSQVEGGEWISGTQVAPSGEDESGSAGTGWLLDQFSVYERLCQHQAEGDKTVDCGEDYALSHALNGNLKTHGLVSYLYTKKSGRGDNNPSHQKATSTGDANRTCMKRKLPKMFEDEEEEESQDPAVESDEELDRAYQLKKARMMDEKGAFEKIQSKNSSSCMQESNGELNKKSRDSLRRGAPNVGGVVPEKKQENALLGTGEAWDNAIDALDFDNGSDQSF